MFRQFRTFPCHQFSALSHFSAPAVSHFFCCGPRRFRTSFFFVRVGAQFSAPSHFFHIVPNLVENLLKQLIFAPCFGSFALYPATNFRHFRTFPPRRFRTFFCACGRSIFGTMTLFHIVPNLVLNLLKQPIFAPCFGSFALFPATVFRQFRTFPPRRFRTFFCACGRSIFGTIALFRIVPNLVLNLLKQPMFASCFGSFALFPATNIETTTQPINFS